MKDWCLPKIMLLGLKLQLNNKQNGCDGMLRHPAGFCPQVAKSRGLSRLKIVFVILIQKKNVDAIAHSIEILTEHCHNIM